MRAAEECEHQQRRMRNERSRIPAAPSLLRWPGVALLALRGGLRSGRRPNQKSNESDVGGDCRTFALRARPSLSLSLRYNARKLDQSYRFEFLSVVPS